MLAAVGGIAHWGKEDGLIYFTLLVQVAMYGETTRVIGGDFAHGLYRWYWFLIASIAWNGPQMMPWWSTQIAAVVSGMTMLGIISSIIQFQWKQAQGDEFRDYLRQAAVSSLSAVRQFFLVYRCQQRRQLDGLGVFGFVLSRRMISRFSHSPI